MGWNREGLRTVGAAAFPAPVRRSKHCAQWWRELELLHVALPAARPLSVQERSFCVRTSTALVLHALVLH